MENIRDISMVPRPNLLCCVVHLCSYTYLITLILSCACLYVYIVATRYNNIYIYVLSLVREALCATVTIL